MHLLLQLRAYSIAACTALALPLALAFALDLSRSAFALTLTLTRGLTLTRALPSARSLCFLPTHSLPTVEYSNFVKNLQPLKELKHTHFKCAFPHTFTLSDGQLTNWWTQGPANVFSVSYLFSLSLYIIMIDVRNEQ